MDQIDKIIKQFSPIVSLNEERFKEFSELLDQHDFSNKFPLNDLETFIGILKNEICNDNCPAEKTVGERAIKKVFEVFNEQARRYVI